MLNLCVHAIEMPFVGGCVSVNHFTFVDCYSGNAVEGYPDADEFGNIGEQKLQMDAFLAENRAACRAGELDAGFKRGLQQLFGRATETQFYYATQILFHEYVTLSVHIST